MKAYFVRGAHTWETNMNITVSPICAFMHEGLVRREGTSDEAMPARYDDSARPPLHIVHNVHRMPEAYLNYFILIASQRIRNELEPFPNMRSQKVAIDKLFDVPWQDGDCGLVKLIPPTVPFERFAQQVEAVDGTPSQLVGHYYEIIVCEYSDTRASAFPETRRITADQVGPDFFEEDVEPFTVRLSPELLDCYPILYHLDGCHILSERVYAILGPHLRPPYYCVESVDVF